MVATHLLAIDQGTTSTRAFLFDAALQPVGFAQLEFPQIFPQPGWVEHDPQGIWTTSVATARAAMASASVSAEDVAAIGITNQRETTIIWERATGKPIHNAIVWQDRRTHDACAALAAAGHEKLVSERAGLLLDPYFSATKIAWLLDNVSGARAAAEAGRLAFGTVDTYLLWRFTGGKVHATDATNAARTALLDIRTGQWDPELLDLFGIPPALLPEVRDSASDFGVTEPTLLGAAVQWLRDGLKLIATAAETGTLAANSDPEDAVYMVPAFVGLGAPWWDAEARGALYGLSRKSGPAEISRAALEAVGYQTRDLLDAMRADWPAGERVVLRVDGGMTPSDYTMQFLADMTGAPVDRPVFMETTALGAAYLAGLKAGVCPDLDGFAKTWKLDRRFEPHMDPHMRERKWQGWQDAVQRTLTPH